MSDDRPWYREPETFIAIAALVVSLSAVVVGIYEASLQRTHDRAEVWPHVEVSTYTSPKLLSVSVLNTGIGPALVRYVMVSVDDKPSVDWRRVLATLLDTAPPGFNVSTIGDRSMRAGETQPVIEIPTDQLPSGFLKQIARVSVTICYSSVFSEYWTMTTHLTGRSSWNPAAKCPAQPDSTDF
jgi:hypothetical protein